MLSAPVQELSYHNSVRNPNGDFPFHLGVPQEMWKNAWNGFKVTKSQDGIQTVMPAMESLDGKKFTTGLLCKAEKSLQTPASDLHSVSETRKKWVEGQQYGHPKPTLRSLISPLNAHRLKPIRQKTKNAVVGIILHFRTIKGLQ